eukprot:SAG31_NODE_3887_length_3780_cov_8.208639_3_plen_46_part_00
MADLADAGGFEAESAEILEAVACSELSASHAAVALPDRLHVYTQV